MSKWRGKECITGHRLMFAKSNGSEVVARSSGVPAPVNRLRDSRVLWARSQRRGAGLRYGVPAGTERVGIARKADPSPVARARDDRSERTAGPSTPAARPPSLRMTGRNSSRSPGRQGDRGMTNGGIVGGYRGPVRLAALAQGRLFDYGGEAPPPLRMTDRRVVILAERRSNNRLCSCSLLLRSVLRRCTRLPREAGRLWCEFAG